MHPYRCKECTLYRCDAEGQACSECAAAAATKNPDTVGHHYHILRAFLTTGIQTGTAQQTPQAPAPPAVPPAAPPAFAGLPLSPTMIAQQLQTMSIQDSASVFRIWLYHAFAWMTSQKGPTFWSDVHDEVARLERGGTP